MLRPYDDGDPPYPFTRREGDNMTTRRSILIGTAIVAGTALWYLFRPEDQATEHPAHATFPARLPAQKKKRRHPPPPPTARFNVSRTTELPACRAEHQTTQ